MAQSYILYRNEETNQQVAIDFGLSLRKHYPAAYTREINFGNVTIREIDDVAVVLMNGDVPLVDIIGNDRQLKKVKTGLERKTGFTLVER